MKVEEIELVVVATPPHLHLPQTLAALKAGKHVLCEKPTALHAGEAHEMWQAAQRAGKLHLIDHELRFNPRRVRMKEMIAEGFVGPVWNVEVRLEGPFRADPARPWSWWSDAAQGGGVLGALGSHAVDAVRALLGEIVEVKGQLATMIKSRPDPHTGEPRPVTVRRLRRAVGPARRRRRGEHAPGGGGARRRTRGSRSTAPGARSRSTPTARCGRARRAPRRGARWCATTRRRRPPGSKVPETPWARAFLLYAAAIREALVHGRTSVPGAATFEDGWRNQRVLDAVRESARRGDWIAVDSMGPHA